MKTLFALLFVVVLASCTSEEQDTTVETTDSLDAGDTARVVLDSIGDSIEILRNEAREKASD